MKIRPLLIAGAVLCLVLPSMAAAQPWFPTGPADDNTSSLGQAIIWVAPQFRTMISAYPGWNQPRPNHWTSPVMSDLVPNGTIIGRSAVHLDGDLSDTGGTPVGLAGTWISDANFTIVPTGGFQAGPAGTREVHTEVWFLHIVDAGQTFALRAGTGAGVAPISPGEVEAKQTSADFPAESFFNVFVQLDTPFYGGTTLFNPANKPMVVVNSNLMALPPAVVYIHGETNAVPVYFANGPYAGVLFGYMRLAGHGVNVSLQQFQQAIEDAPLMPCPHCLSAIEPRPIPIDELPAVPTEPQQLQQP